MQTIEVNDADTRKQFLNICETIYKDDKAYVRPLDDEIEAIFDPHQNAFFKNGIAKRWILKDNDQVIGRIAAFINYNKTANCNKPAGGIGFFECVHNQNAAYYLFDTAKEWLQEKNMKAMDGPVNPGENNNYWGLLVDGFTQPAYGMNYNPPYYKELFEKYGFETLYEQYTNHFDICKPLPARFRNILNRVIKNENYQFEPFKISAFEKYVNDFVDIYNSAWAHHENFQPINPDYVRNSFEQMKPVMEPEMIWFAYVNKKPAGFIVAVPDANQVIKHLNGQMNLWSKVKFMWYKKKGVINKVRVIAMGIKPEYQKKGIESGLIVKAFDAVKTLGHYQQAELSWVGDFNPDMLALHKASGATFGKKHVTYRKDF